MKLTAEQARELAYEGYNPDQEDLGLDVVCNRQVETQRWVSVHELVVQDADGRFWRAFYNQGLTESQDEGPFEYDDEVEFTEVEQFPVTTFEYREIKSS